MSNRYVLENSFYKGLLVEIHIYKTKWLMHSASLRYKKSNKVQNTTHGTLGTTYRWWCDSKRKRNTVCFIMMSWDTLTIEVLSHELLHAAVHLWTYHQEDDGKMLSTNNDEDLCYLHGELLNGILNTFPNNKQTELILKQKP